MKWLAISLALLACSTGCACWRPYYGYNRYNYAAPAMAQGQYPQPAYAQPYAQPTFQQPAVVAQPATVVAQPQYVQAAPTVQCQPCQPCCVPCY